MDVRQRLIITVSVEVETVFKCVTQITLDSTTHAMEVFKALTYDQTSAKTLATYNAVKHRGTREYAGDHLREDFFRSCVPVSQCINTGRQHRVGFIDVTLCFTDDEGAICTHKKSIGHRAAGIDTQNFNGIG